jgi:predicted phosphodiesterase
LNSKTCAKCGSIGPFYKDADKPDGLRPICQKCDAAARRARRQARKQVEEFEITFEDEPPRGSVAPPANLLRKVLFVPDTHVPYHSARAFALMLQAAQSWKPDVIVVLGDFADFYSVSSHSKNAGRVRLLDEEVADVNVALSQLDALGASEKYFVSGNHEDRLERFLQDKAPELFNLVKVRDLFKLDARGWKFTPYKESVKVGHLNLTHDAGQAGKFAFMRAMDTFQGNVIIGHTHRMGVHYEGNSKGESHVSAQFGWLGDVDKIDYMHKVNALRSWQLGFGIGHLAQDGVCFVQAVPVVNYRCIVDGVLYVG